MRKMLSFIFAIAALLVVSFPVHAGPVAGKSVQVKLATTNVGGTTWVPVVTSTVRGVKGISVFSSAALPLEVGVAFAAAGANTEVAQMIVPAALTQVGAPGAIFYPMAVGYGTRISLRVAGSTAANLSSGEVDMSLFYN